MLFNVEALIMTRVCVSKGLYPSRMTHGYLQLSSDFMMVALAAVAQRMTMETR